MHVCGYITLLWLQRSIIKFWRLTKWQVHFLIFVIYFWLTYTQGQFFFFYSERYRRASLANVSICFEDIDKSITPLHSHTIFITFLRTTSENTHHNGSQLYLVKFKLLGQTKSLPQILTCHQCHESCFKQRRAVHAEDYPHFLHRTNLILLTSKYILNGSWRASDEPLDLPPWLSPSPQSSSNHRHWHLILGAAHTGDQTDGIKVTAGLKGPACRSFNRLCSQMQENIHNTCIYSV